MALTSKLFMCLEWMSIAFAGCEGYLLWSYDYCFFKVLFMNPFISWGVNTGILRLKVPETSSGPGVRPDCMSTSKYYTKFYEWLSLTPHSVFFLNSGNTSSISIVPLQEIELI